MSKIEHSDVTKFLNEIKYMVSGIQEALQMGDDGFEENASMQCDEIKKQIETFQVITLSVPDKKETKKKYDYLEYAEGDQQGALTDNGLTNEAEIKIFQATLYQHVKNRIRDKVKAEELAAVPADKLENFIEGATIEPYSLLANKINSNFFWSALKVFQDIAYEIKEERKKSPQQKLAL